MAIIVDGKILRNLQEQVYANMKDIAKMKEGVYVLDEFGIKVVGEVESLADLPTVEEYKEEHEDWAYGDAYAVGTEAPYALYILTRANSENPDDYWFDIGEFPMPGPQGETGAQGPVGPQGPQGNTGASGTPAGFGTITATAQTLVPGSSATATVVASGPDSEKSFAFTFGIPRGQDGEDLDVNWGEIQGTLSDQTDLQDALDDKQDAILNYDSSTANSVTFKDNIILKNESNQTTTIGRASGLAISTDQTTILNASNDAIIPNLNIRPLRDNAISIGNNISRIKDIKMAGVIGDGTHTFTLPSNTGILLTNNDLNGYATQTWVNQQGFITGITSSDVISALGYTPSHVDANPSTTTSTLNSIGIDGINYSLGGGTPSNYVTTDTNQTITGVKYFTKPLHLGETSGLGAVINGGHTPTGSINDLFISVYNQSGSREASQIFLSSDSDGGDIGFTTRNTSDEMSSKIQMQNNISGNGVIKLSATDRIMFTTGSDAITKIYGALIPDTTSWTANKTIATTDQIPTVPTTVSSFTNDAGYITGITSGMVTTALGYTPGTSNFSGDYDDLTDKPTIPTDTSDLTNNAGFITSSALSGYATESWVGQQGYLTSVSWSDVSGKPTFATVATSGDYDDLINKPTIPSATSDLTNDSGFITINDIPVTDVEVNGSSVVSGGLASVTVPTVVSDLTNDAGYVTSADIPTDNSQLTNGAGYITSSALSSYSTTSQMNTAISRAISNQTKETWTFTLSDGTTVTKTIVLG